MDELLIKNDLKLGLNSFDISRKYNYNKKELDLFLIDEFLKRNKNSIICKDLAIKILFDKYNKLTDRELSVKYDLPRNIIKNFFAASKIRMLSSKHYDKSCLTPENVRKIIDLFEDGTTINKLSEMYNLNHSIVADLLKENNINTMKPSFNKDVFLNIDSEEKAYWLGFLFADGYVSKKLPLVELSLQASDIEHLCKYRKFLEAKNIPKLDINNGYNRCRFNVCNVDFKNDLCKIGCVPQKSLILKFPKLIDKELIRHFIRGYFDGDGCLSYTSTDYKNHSEKISLSCSFTGTLDILQSILKILNENNIVMCIHRDKRMSENVACGNMSVNNSKKFCNYIYDNSSIYLERKYSRFKLFKDNNFAVYKSDLINNDRAISEKANSFINKYKNIEFKMTNANSEITNNSNELLVS